MGMPLDLLWLCVPGYVIFQAFLLARSPSGSRTAVLAPLFVMVPVFAYTAFGLATGSNLWPLLLLLTSPLALLYLVVAGLTTRTEPSQTTA